MESVSASSAFAQPMTAAADHARVGWVDTYKLAANAPDAQHGNGRHSAGNTFYVDYSQVLAQIVDMHRFYAQRPETQAIAPAVMSVTTAHRGIMALIMRATDR